jgi:hypothetical protein
MSDVLDNPTLTPTDAGDHDRFKHYVPKDQLTDAHVFGTPLTALCGKKWVPSADPDRFPICPACKEKWEAMS